MSRRCGNAELEWRFNTWEKQANKEMIRLNRTYNYEGYDSGELGNIDEDEYDGGWFFPVSPEELKDQLMDINERLGTVELPENEFWLDRPSRHEEAGTPIAEESTENQVEATDD